MDPAARIDSAYFHLTPTRTRCYLCVTANEKSEKITSGLLDPFLSHLKTAQDQLAKGGYLILLEPDPNNDATWFTKDTVERFVQFVNTPDVLERACTIDSEIAHIEESISVQSDNNIGLSTVHDHHEKQVESIEGTDPVLDADESNAIVPYKSDLQLLETNGSAAQESNSNDQLLGVLERHKLVLQKEQGMAFARAVAAGYDIDHMESLMSFSKCFGASRLMNACLKFMDLWKGRQEIDQLFEIEAAKEPASSPDYSSLNASSTMLANVTNNQNEFSERWPEYCTDLSLENNRKSCNVARPVSTSSSSRSRDSFHTGSQEYIQGQFPHSIFNPWPILRGNQEYMQDQFPHSIFHPWSIHSPVGALPNVLPYPMQGIPFYQNYVGNDPYFHPSNQSVKDFRINAGQRMRQRRHFTDSRDCSTDSGAWNPCTSTTRSHDDLKFNKAVANGKKYRKKASHLGKKRTGLAIRNRNYMASKKHNYSRSNYGSASAPEIDGDELFEAADTKNTKSLLRYSKKRSHTVPDISISFDEEGLIHEKEVDNGQWQEFHSCALKAVNEDQQVIEESPVAFKKDLKEKQCRIRAIDDLSEPGRQDSLETTEGGVSEFQDSQPKAFEEQVRRLSEPRLRRSQHNLSVTSQIAEALSKTMPSDGDESERVPPIFNLDSIQASNLPELKIRISEGPLDVARNMLAVEEMPRVVNGIKSSMTYGSSGLYERNGNLDQDEMSDNPLKEKNVIKLEYEKPTTSTTHASEGMADVVKEHYDNHTPREETEFVLEYTPIHAPVSQLTVEREDRDLIDSQLSFPEATTVYVVKESPKFASTVTVQEPYQAPFARLSSMDYRCTEKCEYDKAPPSSLEMSITEVEADPPKVIVSDFKNLTVERIPENPKILQAEQPSKGLRWLLGLAMKKNPNAGSPKLDSISAVGSEARDNAKNTNASIEVHSLKNLASQEDPPTISTASLMVSRPLSVLSSFGIKSDEKKLVAPWH